MSAVELPEQLTIATVVAVAQALRQRLESTEEPMVDGSRVRRVDASGAQLLLAFAKSLGRGGRQIVWKAPSAALTDGLVGLGLGRALLLPGAGA